MDKNVTKFYVTNWEGRVGLDPNMYDVTNFSLFFFEGFPNLCNLLSSSFKWLTDGNNPNQYLDITLQRLQLETY